MIRSPCREELLDGLAAELAGPAAAVLTACELEELLDELLRGKRVVLRHHGVQGECRPVGGHLQQLGVVLPERPVAERADVQYPMTLPPTSRGTPSRT